MLTEKDCDLLVVDEDDRTRGPAQALLRQRGYDAHCVSSGWAALRFLEHYRPKFAVLDVTTLGDDGLDVLDTIHARPGLGEMPLVVHIAVPDADGGDGYSTRAYLTRGIDWPGRRAELARHVH